MTGAELSAAASDFSVVSLVCLVMMGGCAFGMALGYPWYWMVAAAVLFLLASGHPGTAISLTALAITVRRFAPNVLLWLERLDIGRVSHRRGPAEARYRSDQRRDDGARTPGGKASRGGARYTHDDLFGQRAETERPAASTTVRGSTPESILGIGPGFSMKDLDAARRRLAKKFHPDLHRRASPKKQKYMAEKMRAVNSAYEALKAQGV